MNADPNGPSEQPADPSWTDERIDQIIGNLLRAGVLLSALVVLAGGIVYLVRHGSETEQVESYRHFQPEQTEYHAPAQVIRGASTLRGRALIALGLLLLIATPVCRVAFSVFAFLRQRDTLYVFVTLIVLAVLLYSLFYGHLS
jgi:uncharacterized membrane protein